MTLEQALDHIGDEVVYHPMFAPAEYGVITGASSLMVFALYPDFKYPQATRPGDLELLAATAAGTEG